MDPTLLERRHRVEGGVDRYQERARRSGARPAGQLLEPAVVELQVFHAAGASWKSWNRAGRE